MPFTISPCEFPGRGTKYGAIFRAVRSLGAGGSIVVKCESNNEANKARATVLSKFRGLKIATRVIGSDLFFKRLKEGK